MYAQEKLGILSLDDIGLAPCVGCNKWEVVMSLKLGGQVMVLVHTIPDLRCLVV